MCDGAPGDLQNLSFADGDCALHKYAELVERFDNRLTLTNLRLIERYRDGNLNVVVNGRWNEAIDFRIVLQRADELGSCWDTNAGADGSRAGRCVADVQSAWRDGQERYIQSCEHLNAGRSYRNDALVFVQGVEFVENPQRGIPTLVGLQPSDQPLGLGADALYFSYGLGFKVLDGSADGESSSASYLFSVCDDEFTYELVERRTKVVDGVGDDRTGALWERFLQLHADDVLASFVILLHEEFVGLGIIEGADQRLKFDDMFFGPFDF